MKTIYGMICAFVLSMTISACASKDAFTIDVEIAGVPDGTVMTLIPGATHKDEKPGCQVDTRNSQQKLKIG